MIEVKNTEKVDAKKLNFKKIAPLVPGDFQQLVARRVSDAYSKDEAPAFAPLC